MRRRVPELMDDPALPEVDHRHALAGLARLNTISGSVRTIWRSMSAIASQDDTTSVLDVATGGGDVPIGLWRYAQTGRRQLSLTGIDCSATALTVARERAVAAGAPVTWRRLDALMDPLPPADVVTTSLFLHHLERDDACRLLRRLAEVTRRRLVVSDLVRGPVATGLIAAASRVVCRSRIVHVDAVRSARAAFTLDEVRAVAEDAGLSGGTLTRVHPCRLVLVWDRAT